MSKTSFSLGALPLAVDDIPNDPPDSLWFQTHHNQLSPDKWNLKTLAFGLNVYESDLLELKEMVASNIRRGAIGEAATATRLLYDMDRLLAGLPRRCEAVEIPAVWRIQAIASLCVGTLSTNAQAGTWPKTPFKSPINLPFDCVARIFDFVGLKPGTIQAIARALGFDQVEQQALLHHRCNPLRLLSQITDKPQALLGVMADSNVWLVGSRAVSYFYPGMALSDSDWNFKAHPQLNSSIRFVAYLASQGVQWSTQAVKQSLCGTLIRGNRRIKIELSMFGRSMHSMTGEILSLTQCYISGYAAVCMHAHLTTSGLAKAWESRLWSSTASAQGFLNKYRSRGVRFVRYDDKRHDASMVPQMIPRSLIDEQSLVVPLARYLDCSLHPSAHDVAQRGILGTLQFRWTDAISHTICGLLRLERLHEARRNCKFSILNAEAQDLVARVEFLSSLRTRMADLYGDHHGPYDLEITLARFTGGTRRIQNDILEPDMNCSLNELLRGKVRSYFLTFLDRCQT